MSDIELHESHSCAGEADALMLRTGAQVNCAIELNENSLKGKAHSDMISNEPLLLSWNYPRKFSYGPAWLLFSTAMLAFYFSGLPALLLLELFKHMELGSKMSLAVPSNDSVFRILYIYTIVPVLTFLVPVWVCSLVTVFYRKYLHNALRRLEISSVGLRELSTIGTVGGARLPGFATLLLSLYRLFYRNSTDSEIEQMALVEDLNRLPLKVPLPWQSIISAECGEDVFGNRIVSLEVKTPRYGNHLLKIQTDGLNSSQLKELMDRLVEYIPPERWRVAKANVKRKKKHRLLGYTDIWFARLRPFGRQCKSDYLPCGMKLQKGALEVGESIGGGGLANVYLAAQHVAGKTVEPVVLKEFIHADEDEVIEGGSTIGFENELKALEKIHHEKIVKLKGSFVEDHRSYLILEHIDGISLHNLVRQKGKLLELEVLTLAEQMCEILSHLHSRVVPVIHRDFTPHNLLLQTNGTVKLVDFNAAIHEYRKNEQVDDVVGKPAYVPPEQFRGKAVRQSDIYALGATMYFLLTGEEPEPISQSSPKKVCPELSFEIDRIVGKATAINVNERYFDANILLADLLILRSDLEEMRQ